MVTTYIITPCVGSVGILTKSSDILNKNSLAVKNARGQSEAESVCSYGYKRPKALISVRPRRF